MNQKEVVAFLLSTNARPQKPGLLVSHLSLFDEFRVLDKFPDSSSINGRNTYKLMKLRNDYHECIRDDGVHCNIMKYTRVEPLELSHSDK